jgi:lactate dehydrogenase-like 2-hydroxyacid dehydrogenase
VEAWLNPIPRGIPVGHTPGVLTEATADFAWALLMAAARRVVEGDRYTRSGRWRMWGPTLLLGPDVAGATLGIVGLGRIGAAMARRAAPGAGAPVSSPCPDGRGSPACPTHGGMVESPQDISVSER